MFKKILIANRGEIALRILRACRDLGVCSVVAYSEADRNSLPVKLADETVFIGGGLPAHTYLNFDKIIQAAKSIGADAIHPGYGFLAENYEFAKLCKKQGITFIGPPWEVIRYLGDKVRARQTAQRLRVFITPGSKGVLKSVDEALKVAKQVGYPVVLKAVEGGGGRGMRIVSSPPEMERAYTAASTEAQAAFGNASLYLEKYFERPRHIEVQILCDAHGHRVHLFERECSIQRRHQKLIEESPSPVVTPKVRSKLTSSAIRIARAVGYIGAGTVEFLLTEDAKTFYFMEVNARIQVEHPVTEMVTGVDIVKEQIRIAAGEELSFTQKQLELQGWAMECRITAEDPERGFAPTPGLIQEIHIPSGPGIRVDTALFAGYEIPQIYDSLIAKVIAHGKDREEVISRMTRALSEFFISGIKTSIPFHLTILASEAFREGALSTGFIEEKMKRYVERTEEEDAAGAIISALVEMNRRLKGGVLTRRELAPAPLWAITGRQEITRRTS